MPEHLNMDWVDSVRVYISNTNIHIYVVELIGLTIRIFLFCSMSLSISLREHLALILNCGKHRLCGTTSMLV